MLRQRIAEEGRDELERRKRAMEEDRRKDAEKEELTRKSEAELMDLRAELETLKVCDICCPIVTSQ